MAIQDCEEFPCQVVYAGISSPIRPLSAIFARRTSMRQTRTPQLALGEARIEDIKLDHKSRDDIPAVLLGLQHLYSHEKTREKLFSLLDEHIVPSTNRNVGRPGMELWRILVMGVLKQGLGCDFDRLHEGVPPKLIIFNGFLVGAKAQHCQARIRQRDRFATTRTIPSRNDCFGAARAASEWPARRAHSTACPNA